jgi:hypothetical protein
MDWPDSCLFTSAWSQDNYAKVAGWSRSQFSEDAGQFGERGYLLALAAGEHKNVAVHLTYSMQAVGTGLSPEDTRVYGAVYTLGVQGGLSSLPNLGGACGCNADNTFRRALGNMTIVVPASGEGVPFANCLSWASSQMCPVRGVRIEGSLAVNSCSAKSSRDCWTSGVSAGQNSVITGTVYLQHYDAAARQAYGQEQFLLRNATCGGVVSTGIATFVGNKIPGVAQDLAATPAIREVPFLAYHGGWFLVVPGLERGKIGATCSAPPGTRFVATSACQFVRPDSVGSAQAALDAGRPVVFFPGTYRLAQTLRVTLPDAVLLGLGMPTVLGPKGAPVLTVGAGAHNCTVSQLVLGAGDGSDSTFDLVTVGAKGGPKPPADALTVFHDVQLAIGGWNGANVKVDLHDGFALTIYSSQVVLDNVHVWVADHGRFGGWGGACGHQCQFELVGAKGGVRVFGDDVACYGLCIEHFRAGPYLEWHGLRGSVYGYMSEVAYWFPEPTMGPVILVAEEARASFVIKKIGIYTFFKESPKVPTCTVPPYRIEQPSYSAC